MMREERKLCCNQCGKEIQTTQGIAREDFVMVKKNWGYFSKKAGRQDEFCLCEACYDRLIAGFLVPVTEKEMTELV